MKAEIIVAIVSLVVALPPTLYALHAWYRRRSQTPSRYHTGTKGRRRSANYLARTDSQSIRPWNGIELLK
ncbi:uncharacterized protein FPRO_07021 [Fusarium proliferatum ET1]|uniref:Uncharacterized protein n=1 Tax=Fusarium proliferatum (strain ET1) TaxID=1227346 RepID=A0A1L7VAL1_FUSPR|nr:uncharacterized protein FPRO_07021 [Fusarium proliferatum ET1]CZR37788.1 uncharacterized protein FPRO_07021 [Fusarium proliferatum ET1]